MNVVGIRPDPTERQRAAADPSASVWVSASAGSGKTKVLTDRVLSLLLEGVPPERILCLTFTKAAAAEMAVRINRQLSKWAMAADWELNELLEELAGYAPPEETARLARQLFARVLDVPGGLKIQTIHAFCQSLLGRFPIEAGLAPHFEVIDERSAAELLDAARDDVLRRSLGFGDLRAALATVSEHVNEIRFGELMGELAKERHRLERFLDGHGGLKPAVAAIRAELSLDPDESDERVLDRAADDATFDAAALREAASVLLAGGNKGDTDRGGRIADWLALDKPGRIAGFDDYTSAFLTAGGSIRSTLATKPVREAHPHCVDALNAEAQRISGVQDLRRALVTAEATAGLLRLGEELLRSYDQAKRSLARLDYEDLILKTADLLHRQNVAPWVLFKLDGGIDHILIDEAQDTSPQQWAVIARLADEFFAGEGTRPEAVRTIFAVGDMKQSIFSFQHADPEEFRRMREYFAARVVDSGGTWQPVELDMSFRSAASVLQAVDAVFASGTAPAGVVEPGARLTHYAFREGQAGRVEVWPTVAPREQDEEEPWAAPVTRRAGNDPAGRLAAVLAAQIGDWIGTEILESRGRPVRAGDIMVLVRTRTGFVEKLVRALKDRGVPVSGVDRMVLTRQIAVMDLLALGRFLLLPIDDLTLATVLKCPLVGFDDDDLFRLAWNRGERSLWQRLQEEAATDARFEGARSWLAGLLGRTDYFRPYELFSALLSAPTVGQQNGRQCMLARLGPDAEDPIDEFLSLALAHERSHAPSLESFLHWVEAGEATVKRDLEQAGRDEVRVMTVHGSKGLQAPIVIMPDTTSKPRVSPPLLWHGDMPLWPPRSEYRDPVCENVLEDMKYRTAEEYRRLLYVAMTRAEDRLYVCGSEGLRPPPEDCWYRLIADGLAERADETEFSFAEPAADGWSGSGLVLANPQEAEPKDAGRALPAYATGTVPAEEWMLRPPPAESDPPRPLMPSRPKEPEPPVLSPAGGDSSRRFHRGIIIHRLLEAVPDVPAGSRRAAAANYLSRPVHGLDGPSQQQILDEVMAVVEDEGFAAIFAPGSRAEVPITGIVEAPGGPRTISGQIDRLAVTRDSVLIIDYKSNRPPPQTVAEVPEIYWRQMAAYRAIIAGIYPDRRIRCALLWTDGPRLMELEGWRLDRASTRP